jgi:hypothetical protein
MPMENPAVFPLNLSINLNSLILCLLFVIVPPCAAPINSKINRHGRLRVGEICRTNGAAMGYSIHIRVVGHVGLIFTTFGRYLACLH